MACWDEACLEHALVKELEMLVDINNVRRCNNSLASYGEMRGHLTISEITVDSVKPISRLGY